MKKYWFKYKRIGWGFTPISWEGWLATLFLTLCLLLEIYLNNLNSLRGKIMMGIEVPVTIIIFIFMVKGKVKPKN